MAEIKIRAVDGDAVSRLLQVAAKTQGITEIRWTGVGHQDVVMVMQELRKALLVKEVFFKGVAQLCKMPEAETLPESMQAQMMGIILSAHSNLELEIPNVPKPRTLPGVAPGSA
jgi:hypothetical protein